MIKTLRVVKPLLTRTVRYRFAHDWSHIYDGIYRFEDNTLG